MSVAVVKPKLLTDLPNEIQARIFEEAIPEGRNAQSNHIHIECMGIAPKLAYGTRPQWSLPWVPDLRLVSKSIEKIVTPIIGRRTQINITRIPVKPWQSNDLKRATTQKALQVRSFLPKYMVDQVERIVIKDGTFTNFLYPVALISVAGLPRLKTLKYTDFDPCHVLHILLSALSAMGPIKGCQRFLKIYQLLSDYNKTPEAAENTPDLQGLIDQYGLQPVAASALYNIVEGLFKSPVGYRDVCSQLTTGVCDFKRDNIEDLLPTTELILEIMDNDRDVVVS